MIITEQNYDISPEYSLLPMGLNVERWFSPIGMNGRDKYPQTLKSITDIFLHLLAQSMKESF
ncbi:MAG: hypothetical protein WDA22_16585 [Bacteroidota bacterium]